MFLTSYLLSSVFAIGNSQHVTILTSTWDTLHIEGEEGLPPTSTLKVQNS